MKSYRDLNAWREAMSLAVSVYEATGSFPRSELYGLTQQMRRAATSVPSNIAEAYGRRTPRQRYNFLEYALGSLFELETQIELSRRLGFLPESTTLSDAIRLVGRDLTGLMRYVDSENRARPERPPQDR